MFNNFFTLPGAFLTVLALTGLAALMIYSATKGEQIYNNLQEQIANPNLNETQTVCLSFIKIKDIDNSEARAIDRRLKIYYLDIEESSEVKKGGTYSLTGYIQPSGRIKVTEIQAHRHRKLKYLFSGFSFFIAIFMIGKYFRLNKTGIYLKEGLTKNFETSGKNNH